MAQECSIVMRGRSCATDNSETHGENGTRTHYTKPSCILQPTRCRFIIRFLLYLPIFNPGIVEGGGSGCNPLLPHPTSIDAEDCISRTEVGQGDNPEYTIRQDLLVRMHALTTTNDEICTHLNNKKVLSD